MKSFERTLGRTAPIRIACTNGTSKLSNEYELNKTFFDPFKHSPPPNDFMQKLDKRMKTYGSFNNLDSLITQ